MPEITISVPEQLEQRIRERAVARGRGIEDEILDTLAGWYNPDDVVAWIRAVRDSARGILVFEPEELDG